MAWEEQRVNIQSMLPTTLPVPEKQLVPTVVRKVEAAINPDMFF